MNDLPARTPFQDAMDAIYNPDWKPLERAVQLAGLPLRTCGDFMFMHQDTRGVCHYKHIDTRNYASLRIDSTPEVCVAELAKARSMERTWGKALDAACCPNGMEHQNCNRDDCECSCHTQLARGCTCGHLPGQHQPDCPLWDSHVDNYEADV